MPPIRPEVGGISGGEWVVERWHPVLDFVSPDDNEETGDAPEEVREVQVEAGGEGAGQRRAVGEEREGRNVSGLVHEETI